MIDTLSTVTAHNRTVSVKAIDFRISADTRDLEYRISVGDSTLYVSHKELTSIASIAVSYIKPAELQTTLEGAKALNEHLIPFIEKKQKELQRMQRSNQRISAENRI